MHHNLPYNIGMEHEQPIDMLCAFYQADTGENICLQRCVAACCRNPRFSNLPEKDFRKVVKDRTLKFPVPSETAFHILEENASVVPQGAYYTENQYGNYNVQIIGNCPNLRADNSCQIYAERPSACKNLSVRSRDCSAARKEIG